ncbi:MAG: helix-turn-helix domain-containing protein [Alphaproteobacteria bacterium]|jgi:hypothetical protein|nr:helix-turn-helix domain-containing protein [Alphaproteobacteria bacterium]MBT4085132.1 helix-turn-helix domain-containing protein [Alphaproteobacteria bacterium]MBT4543252.1 helix-turn-helix domain-containing protein [Alphaproteobacteria bacterium]
MITKHLHQVHLAERWNLSPRTLERWRWEKIGPRYLKLGGRVVYRLKDVEAYEAKQVRNTEGSTSTPLPLLSVVGAS